MPLLADNGFVIRKTKINEYDYIIDIFSENHGKVTLISKSSRKINSSKLGKLELLTNNKFAYTKSDNIGLLTEVEQVESFENLRESKSGKFAIFYISEILSHYLTTNDDLSSLYNVVFNSLKNANISSQKTFIEIMRICYEIIEREQQEYMTVCLICDKEIKSNKIKNFSDYLICQNCQLQNDYYEENLNNNVGLKVKDANKVDKLVKKLSLTNELIENIINRNINSFNLLFYKK